MRVNIDAVAFSDPRFRRLGARIKASWFEAIGRCLPLWAAAYAQRSPIMCEPDIDAITESPGFAQCMIAVGLARAVASGIWVCGVEDRIQWLLIQDAKRQKALDAKRERAGVVPRDRPPGDPAGQPPGRPHDMLREGPYSPALDPTLTLDPVPDPAPEPKGTPNPLKGDRARSRKKPTPKYTEDELAGIKLVLQKLTNRNQVKYEGSEAHKALIASRLRAGYSTWDMRRVIAYCADHLGWQDNPDMIAYLRPETLFGPKTMEKYVYAARAWDPAGEPPEAAQQGPPKTENVRPGANGEASAQASNVIPLRPQPGILGMFDDPAFEEPSWMTTIQTTTKK